MAPPPEYDKEPKAPDKSATNIPCEDPKALYNLVNEHQTNSDTKSMNSTANAEENNKHVETLDDGQLRALLDEAITYKCPKDREGKSSLFKELLEEVEQDEQACEAAARATGRARRGAGGGALPHSNSLQELVAALAAEPAPRRRHPHHPHLHPAAPVSARAIHGGSLPSGVDTSFLLSEEPMRGVGGVSGGAEYVATVRCVNPSPLAERRVSASDAHPPMDPDNTARRSKPAFPMTYTARATLEIGSGSVGSGRAVTTTTASNQVRTPAAAARPRLSGKRRPPRGPHPHPHPSHTGAGDTHTKEKTHWDDSEYIDKWYRGLDVYRSPLDQISPAVMLGRNHINKRQTDPHSGRLDDSGRSQIDLANPSPLKSDPKAFMINAPRPKLISKSDKHIPVVVKERDIAVDVEHPKDDIDHDDEIRVVANNSVIDNEDAIARKKYRERVGQGLVVPTLSSYNPKNVRRMTIGKPLPHAATSDKHNQNSSISRAAEDKSVKDKHYCKSSKRNSNVEAVTDKTAATKSGNKHAQSESLSKIYRRTAGKQNRPSSPQNTVMSNFNHDVPSKNKYPDQDSKDTKDSAVTSIEPQIEPKTETDTELVEMGSLKRSSNSDHSNEFSLFIANQQRLLQAIENNNCKEKKVNKEEKIIKEVRFSFDTEPPEAKNDRPKNIENLLPEAKHPLEEVSMMDCSDDRESDNPGIELVEMKRTVDVKVSEEKPRSGEAPSDASIFLTLYKRLLASPSNIDNTVLEVKSAGDAKPMLAGLDGGAAKLPKKKKDKITSRLSRKPHNENSTKKKDIIRNALKKLFFDNITQNDGTNKLTGKAVAIASTSTQVDSAIPFSCITTPEVVASCTTTASAQAAAPLDTKMGRSALTSSFASHGGPLPRAGPAFSAAAAVAVAAAEEFKKSLDENGNSVQGFSSPQSGSSQQKKQRRKKSSKNETVIKSHHIDGYQGNKDLNEVLRFIESAEPERPAKRHDDKKKRSAERRKDKQPRASSLDDLRAPPPPARPARPARPAAAPAPERRSWGHDARDYFRHTDPEPDALELTDFQTVTKKRKPRRRADLEPRAPPAVDPPSPDRSNDSNDDVDSVRSLPALPERARAPLPLPPPPPPPPAPVSYADIARTRHNNIPDLIESCNYYGEGEEPPPAAPGDALAYPALEARRRPHKPPPAPPAGARKPAEPPEPPEPAPDVVADRRPAVILLDAPARARDLDGVTFGFDVNEQLLSGARRPRCDLVRDAAAAEPPAPAPAPAPPAPPALRYVPPAPPRDTHHLHQIIDYVGTAWEEVVRCGGKVRYFSE